MNEDEKYKQAYEDWDRKTWWMNEKGAIPAKYLGMHKADVLKAMLDEKDEEIANLKETIRILKMTDKEWLDWDEDEQN